MRLDVFDVGHGSCAMVTAPNGKRVMLDCGFNTDRKWFPSVVFAGQHIDLLVALNLDEDHVGELPYMWDKVTIGGFVSNPTVSAQALRAMKTQGIDSGVTEVLRILPFCIDGLLGQRPVDSAGVDAWYYCNRFGEFDDTNNLSLAVFVRYGAFTALFAGDLEKAGWRALLRDPSFVRDLSSVNVMVASHHGRESGCCAEAFDHFRPQLVIFSDADIQHQTQSTSAWYGARTVGIPDYSARPQPSGEPALRKVLTTRCDGSINISVSERGDYLVTPERHVPVPKLDVFATYRRTNWLAQPALGGRQSHWSS